MPRPLPDQPPTSAFDLPSFRQMDRDLRAAKLFGVLLGQEARQKLAEVERGMRELGDSIDRFYKILGPRNWVYHDLLRPDAVANILSVADSADDAERMFIQLHTDGEWLEFWVRQVSRREGLDRWESMISNALEDYKSGRYRSTAMILLAVMDGYVNEVDISNRRGLHARAPEEMKTWDRVAGHHMGLTNVMKTMFRPFKKPVDDEVFELNRNGIMHGNVIHFNNDIVATKAWNYFFAVLDWADDVRQRSKPEKANPTWGEICGRIRENADTKRAIANWRPSTLKPSDSHWASDDLVAEATAFFQYWRNKNYGKLAQTMQHSHLIRRGSGAAAFCRKHFGRCEIEDFHIRQVDFTAAAVGVVTATVSVGGQHVPTEVRWIRETDEGILRPVGMTGGRWRRAFDGCPDH